MTAALDSGCCQAETGYCCSCGGRPVGLWQRSWFLNGGLASEPAPGLPGGVTELNRQTDLILVA